MENVSSLPLKQREMSYTHITPSNQNELSVLLRAKTKQKDIARLLGKHRTTVWRERKRNGDRNGKYHARKAKEKTAVRQEDGHRSQRKIENNRWLRTYIEAKLRKRWSPEQIAGRLELLYANDKRKRIGKDSIYVFIYAKRNDLVRFLRCRKGRYRRSYGTRIRVKTREEAKKRRIDARPAIIEEKGRIGDWEGDTIVGNDKNHILTHNERKSGLLVADILTTPTAEATKRATIASFKKIPRSKRHTITYDNGLTFAYYEMTERILGILIYFAYPYHSWERGCNENSNGLLRQYFPKKTPLGKVTNEELQKAVREINGRPRKRHGYRTPYEIFNENAKNATDEN